MNSQRIKDKMKRIEALDKFDKEVKQEEKRIRRMSYTDRLVEFGDYLSDGSDSGMSLEDKENE